jgi:hypothetical protein
MEVWSLIDEDEHLIRIYRDLEDLFASYDIEHVLSEWPGFFGPTDLGDVSAAWPPVMDSPHYGDRWFVRLWDPIEGDHRFMLAIKEHVYVYGDNGANEGVTHNGGPTGFPCKNCNNPVTVNIEWRHIDNGCNNPEPNYPKEDI